MQRDYIMRQIEQMAAVLARMLDQVLARKLPVDELRQELDEAGRTLGYDLDLARTVSPETLLLLLSPAGTPDPGRCWVFAESLYIEGLSTHQAGRTDEATALLTRARLLYQSLQHHPALPDLTPRLTEIEARLNT